MGQITVKILVFGGICVAEYHAQRNKKIRYLGLTTRSRCVASETEQNLLFGPGPPRRHLTYLNPPSRALTLVPDVVDLVHRKVR